MQQQISVITLGVTDLSRSRSFYVQGFGWVPVFENSEIIFYQMNGFVLGTFLKASLEEDMGRSTQLEAGAYALAHNVPDRGDVGRVMERLANSGGHVMRAADAPAHGGYRGYVADPDGHAWEIAWNPAWQIDENGHVTFGS